jgi:hypothetical protein
MIDASASLAAHMQQALQRFQSKVSVDAVLRGLSADARQAVLVDLLAAYDQEASGTSSVPTLTAPVVTTPRVGLQSRPAERGGPAVSPPNATRTNAAPIADRLLAVLQGQPEAPIEQLTQTLYGSSDAANRNRLSTVLSQLKRRGKVHMVRRGKWRVVEPRRSVKKPWPPTTKRIVAAQVPSKPVRRSQKPAHATRTPSTSERVRALLLSHPEGLSTRQMRELLGNEVPGNQVSTVVVKMRVRGILVATGEKGSSVYKLSAGSPKGAE